MPFYDYQCDICHKIEKDIILTFDEHEHPETVHELHCYCTKNGSIMKQAFFEAPGIVTMTKSRIQTDMSVKRKVTTERRKRANEHFKKEVFPTINKKDKAHFATKHGIKM